MQGERELQKGALMNLRKLMVISSLVLGVAALSPTAAQGATTSSAAVGHEIPFKGFVAGTETNNGAFPIQDIQGKGVGVATHLGAFTYDNPHTVNLLTRHGCGTLAVRAVNGDTLTADACGDATTISGTPPNAILSIVETGNFTGGTGRFAGATGSVTIERRFNQSTKRFVGSFEGTISLLGANSGKRTRSALQGKVEREFCDVQC